MNEERERYLTTALREALAREHELATELRRREEYGLDERDDPPPPPWLNDPPEIAPRPGQMFCIGGALYIVNAIHQQAGAGQPERLTIEFVEFSTFLQRQRQALDGITAAFGGQRVAAKAAAKAFSDMAAAFAAGRLAHPRPRFLP